MGKIISVIHLNQKAEIYLTQGKLEEAITACQQVLEIELDFPPTCKILGNILQKMGEINQAKEWYIKAINQQPNLAESYANLGSIYAQQKQWQLAIECYREAIGIKPNIPGFYRNLGKIWQELGKVELARDCQEQALTLEAYYPQASEYLKQGKNCLENDEIEEAIAYFQKAIELNPFLANAYQNLGDISLKTKDFNGAINYYQKAIELKPDFWAVHHKLGKIFQERGELNLAISNFRLAIEINPNFPWSYKKLGDIFEQKGDLESAEKYYQKVIEIKSDIWEIRRKLAEIKLKIGKLDAAIIECQTVIETNPNLPSFYQILGDALAQKEKWDESITAYQTATKIKPNNYLFHEKLGYALKQVDESYIPKTIWVYWENVYSQEMPDYLKLCLETMKIHSGLADVILVNPQNVKAYLKEIHPRIFTKTLLPAHKADYLRIKLLNDNGGMWIDLDTIVFKNLYTNFISHLKDFDLVTLGSAFALTSFAARPQHNFLQTCINQIEAIFDSGKHISWTELGKELICKEAKNYKYYNVKLRAWLVPWKEWEKFLKPGKLNVKNYLFCPLYNKFMFEPLKNVSKAEIISSNTLLSYLYKKAGIMNN
ncbi:tetratricopeptide repeat protein [Okeania sp.]|uniref:tetratricopeptide repeat protein n=1 Tax=Okeania sp. TaxID=3100323 RepID=UPI002B4B841F|nr:tetratricopeptide repeat protein [Okeania sp.]MEB3340189.1 tetratricopeptide repeat protein [Okeania sp.]